MRLKSPKLSCLIFSSLLSNWLLPSRVRDQHYGAEISVSAKNTINSVQIDTVTPCQRLNLESPLILR